MCIQVESVVRVSTDADLTAIAAIQEAIYPEHVCSTEKLRYLDARTRESYHAKRWVAEQNGEVVGWAGILDRRVGRSEPLRLTLQVHPAAQGRGIGTELYHTAEASLARRKRIDLHTAIREDHPVALRFAERRGFVETARYCESALDMGGFDPEPWRWARERMEREGIGITTLKEACEQVDPLWIEDLFELYTAVRNELPGAPIPSYQWGAFMSLLMNNPALSPDYFFMAEHEDGYVGLCYLLMGPDGTLYTGLTGVLPEFRRRGIATALKVAAIERARTDGFRTIVALNSAANEAILSLNHRLGFVNRPAWIEYAQNLPQRHRGTE